LKLSDRARTKFEAAVGTLYYVESAGGTVDGLFVAVRLRVHSYSGNFE
jgi:hypothetical protein